MCHVIDLAIERRPRIVFLVVLFQLGKGYSCKSVNPLHICVNVWPVAKRDMSSPEGLSRISLDSPNLVAHVRVLEPPSSKVS